MIRLAILSFALGCVLLQTQPQLPALSWAGLLPLAVLGAYWMPGHGNWLRFRQVALLLAALATGFLYAAWRADLRLTEQLPLAWEGQDISLTGRVFGLPETTAKGYRLNIETAITHTPGAVTPRLLQLTRYVPPDAGTAHGEPIPRAGDCLRITVRLQRPHGLMNPNGMDREAWLLERAIRATGKITGQLIPAQECPARALSWIDQIRDSLRQDMLIRLGERPYAGIVIALALGDQNAIPSSQWTLFRQTGVSHLFSVSGLHITLFAALVLATVSAVWRRLPSLALRIPARRMGIALGLAAAGAYTLLSGYGIPAQRTLAMLAGAATYAWMDRAPAPSRLLAAALLLVVLFDPWAALAPGFWLSFCAVAALLWTAMGGSESSTSVWRQWLKAQWAVTIALTPLLLALFHEVSLVSPLANAVAIPIVSLAAVPLALLTALTPWAAAIAHGLIQLVMTVLETLAALPQPVFHAASPQLPALLLALLGALLLLLPRGIPGRWMGLLLFLPLFFPRLPRPTPGEAWLTLLDVGQGQATVIRTANHALLVDAGPAHSDGEDAGQRTIAPYLWGMGINRLDGLMISHDDIDHSGGAASLTDSHAPAWILTSIADKPAEQRGLAGQRLLQARPDALPCRAGQHWEWDGVRFTLLHPSEPQKEPKKDHQPTKPAPPDNDLSCTLRIETSHGVALITGDLEFQGERHLMAQQAIHPAQVLVVGHHGSRRSSSPEFLSELRPRLALISAGRNNRYGHPHPETLERLADVGAQTRRTDREGALTVRFVPHGIKVDSARELRRRYWHEPYRSPITPDASVPGDGISLLDDR